MTRLNSNIKFTIGLILFCGAYWLLDSAWAYLSFEKNLSALIFQEPMSYVDTLLLKVPPYQVVSRIMVTGIFIVSGTLIAIFIRKRKKAEEDKIRLERQLQQAQKMESLGTLAGGIAHDFNNILYGAIGYAELCLDDTEPGTILEDNLKEVISGLLRAKSLVKQILAFSRPTDSEIEPTPVTPIVNEAVSLLKSTIPATIAIEVDADVENSTIKGDPTQIHQVIMNLCTNAAHAMEEDGGVLKIALENVEIGTSQEDQTAAKLPPGAYLKLSVADSGIGIPTDNLDRVFDPFFTSKEQGKGTGMGLAVVHGIVKAYDGQILVESKENHGTTFDVFFPLLEDNEAHNQDDANPLPKGHEHILLVDDRPQLVHLQKQVLEGLGYTVTAQNNGLEVLAAIAAHRDAYDAVITDMTMPKMAGDLLAEKIKGMRSDLPVILCSGYSEKISNVKAREIGIDAFLMKPVGKTKLARTLRRVLDK